MSDTLKFDYKLVWLDAFAQRAKKLLHSSDPVILGGDFNIIKTDKDVYNPELFRGNALFRPEVIDRFRAIEYQGWSDAFLHTQMKSSAVMEKTEN